MKAKNNFFKCRLSALQIFVDYRACALFSSRDGTVMAFKAFPFACFRPSIVDNKSPNPFPLFCCRKDLDYTPLVLESLHLSTFTFSGRNTRIFCNFWCKRKNYCGFRQFKKFRSEMVSPGQQSSEVRVRQDQPEIVSNHQKMSVEQG